MTTQISETDRQVEEQIRLDEAGTLRAKLGGAVSGFGIVVWPMYYSGIDQRIILVAVAVLFGAGVALLIDGLHLQYRARRIERADLLRAGWGTTTERHRRPQLRRRRGDRA